MYEGAVLTVIQKVEEHPNADKIQVATVLGEKVVVGLDMKEGDCVVYFSCDTQLSHQFCGANDLIARYDDNKKKIGGGFFDEKRRVRAQGFRGVKSNGFVVPLLYFNYLNENDRLFFHSQKIGFTFTEINGQPICNRYIVPVKIPSGNKGKTKVNREISVPTFLEHFDTQNLRYHLEDKVSYGDRIYVTSKAHGTSQRLHRGIDYTPFKNQWLNKIYNRYLKPIYKHWVGSRRVIKGTIEKTPINMLQNMPLLSRKWPYIQFKYQGSTIKRGYYSDEEFRFTDVAHLILHKGETLYGEHVGWVNLETPIMPPVSLKKLPKEIQKIYKPYWKDNLYFTYGCQIGTRRLLVYRITWTNEEGVTYELPWSLVKKRCKELNLETVYDLDMFYVSCKNDSKTLGEILPDFSEFMERPDPLDRTHYMEGVCVRIEREDGTMDIYKSKSHTFLIGEGHIKDEGTADMEEIESYGGINK